MVQEPINKPVVCVVGLGYVGYPLAEAFSRHIRTIGFDIDSNKIKLIKKSGSKISVTSDSSKIKEADYIIICVPTPVTKTKQPEPQYVPQQKLSGKT
jgi:UDPglucose 6-dehydrogenase/UDP-N-acetyl-D-galactosamine dehydrogenase